MDARAAGADGHGKYPDRSTTGTTCGRNEGIANIGVETRPHRAVYQVIGSKFVNLPWICRGTALGLGTAAGERRAANSRSSKY